MQLDLQQMQQHLPAFWPVCMLQVRSVSQQVWPKSMMPCSALQVPAAADSSAGLPDSGSHPEGHRMRPQRTQKQSKPYRLGSQQQASMSCSSGLQYSPDSFVQTSVLRHQRYCRAVLHCLKVYLLTVPLVQHDSSLPACLPVT